MKISLNQKIKDLDGEAIETQIIKGKKVKTEILTLGSAITQALTNNYKDDQELSGNEKVKRFTLAQKIYRKKETSVDLKVEEITLIKNLIGKSYGTLVVGQIWQILEK